MSVHIRHPASAFPNAHRIQFLRQRAQHLYREGGEIAQRSTVLRTAFDELSIVLDLLQTTEQEHQHEREAWLDERSRLEAEIQSRHELFDLAPLAHIITSLDGTIRQANAASISLLQADEKLLIGRSLGFFTPDGQRRDFRHSIAALQQQHDLQTLELMMQTWEGSPFEAELVVAVTRSHDGKPQHLRWQIQNVALRKQAERMLHERIAEFEERLCNKA